MSFLRVSSLAKPDMIFADKCRSTHGFLHVSQCFSVRSAASAGGVGIGRRRRDSCAGRGRRCVKRQVRRTTAPAVTPHTLAIARSPHR
jgi:hypothetical protein